MTEETKPSLFLAVLGGITLITVLPIVLIIFNGFVYSQIWNWLAVPLFNLRSLNIVQAIAFSLLVAYFMPTTETKKENAVPKLVGTVLGKFLVLGVAWILHFYI